MAQLQNVETPYNSVGAISDNLGSGITVLELQTMLSNLDLNNAADCQQLAACCSPCCSGNDVDIDVNIPIPLSVAPSPGTTTQAIKLRFTMPTV